MTTTQAKARLALDKRRRADESLASLFCRVEGHVPAHWTDLVVRIDQWLADRAANGPAKITTRIVVDAPPGAAKSTLAALVAARTVTRGIDALLFSYSGGLARSKSGKAQKIAINYLGAKVDKDQRSPGHWQLENGGSMHASGLSGSGTGFRGGVIIVDDHTLGRATAESALHRAATNDAVKAVARTRAEPGSLVAIVSTRWHPDDASAHAIAAGYERFSVPALTEAGESFWPERFSTESLLSMRDELGDRDWAALYCGTPQSNASLLFQGVTLLDPKLLPEGRPVVAGLDLAYSSRSSSDASVALVIARLADGRSCVVDVLREQLTIEALTPRLLAFSAKHGNPAFRWRVAGQEEAVASMLRRDGLRITTTRATTDKISNAQRVASAWNRGRLLVLAGQRWTDKFVAEIAAFGPGARHDDQLDALANAFENVPAESVESAGFYQPRRDPFYENHPVKIPEFSDRGLGALRRRGWGSL